MKPLFDAALTSAPVSISSCTTSAWPSAAAHISAVWPLCDSAALTFAPARSTASPPQRCRRRRRSSARSRRPSARPSASAPAFEEFLDQRGVAVGARQRERRLAIFVRGVHLRAGGEQQLRRFALVEVDGPGERRCAVGSAPRSRRRVARASDATALWSRRLMASIRRMVAGRNGGGEPEACQQNASPHGATLPNTLGEFAGAVAEALAAGRPPCPACSAAGCSSACPSGSVRWRPPLICPRRRPPARAADRGACARCRRRCCCRRESGE